MPTAPVVTYSNARLDPLANPSAARLDHVNLLPGTYAAGTLIGPVTATPGTWGAYASGNTNGTQVPGRILQYGCVVDGSGNIFQGGQASSEFGNSSKSAPAYRGGYFSSADIVGLDAAALAAWPGARLLEGSVSNGKVFFPGSG